MSHTKQTIISILLTILASINVTYAQKVGLVLSGGGAKGLTHIGIIRALEENDIPIDYITGTSMGAIVGSMYAMGYSPDEMEELIKSPDFKRWYTGEIEDKYMYYFKKDLPSPDFIDIRFSFGDSVKVKPKFLPTSVVNPIHMNLVFIDLFARATTACRGNFDNLFVPFRCVASDVYNKKQIVLEGGDLGDAVRASMSYPLMFKPIEIGGVLAYDGGIYNNFPTDIMQQDFHPDIIIGSVVSSNPIKPQENDLMSQIENMVMQRTDYTIPDSVGILMTYKYDNISLMDFHKIDQLHDIGYNRTMELMDSIKLRIPRRVDHKELAYKRKLYKSTFQDLHFKHIYIEGANAQQQQYIKNEFHRSENEEFTYEDLKKGYFRLLTGNMISEIIPHAIYNRSNNTYDLYLNVKMEDDFSIRIGGNISTSNSNQLYLGVRYQNLNYVAKELLLDGQLGKVYNNLQFMGRLDFTTEIPTSLRFIASISTFNYKKDKLFSSSSTPAFNKKDERFLKLKFSLPFLTNKRAEFGLGLAQLNDKYFQSNLINFEKDKYDKSSYTVFGGSISFNGSTLNSNQYATSGSREALVAQIFTGKERFRAYDKNSENAVVNGEKQSWLQLSYTHEAYHQLPRQWVLGWYLRAIYASRNFSSNYTATMMQANEFSPTLHSQLSYNEAFRANQYIGAGLKPIYKFNSMFHVRGELYGFLPIFPIERNSVNKAFYGKAFSKFEYLGELSLVCKLPFATVSAYVNYYSSPRKNWNVGLTIGWQLFNYRFFE